MGTSVDLRDSMITYQSPSVTIDHEGDVPVYLQLAAVLRGQIERGELAPRRPLPSINRLSQQYEVGAGHRREGATGTQGRRLGPHCRSAAASTLFPSDSSGRP